MKMPTRDFVMLSIKYEEWLDILKPLKDNILSIIIISSSINFRKHDDFPVTKICLVCNFDLWVISNLLDSNNFTTMKRFILNLIK
jgi:hypothetical protein